jgi:hypothetical protein
MKMNGEGMKFYTVCEEIAGYSFQFYLLSFFRKYL